jgi:hypothetical protein
VRVASGVDPTSDRPVYRQIADQLRAAIEAGELGPWDRLPSESELMRRYRVAQGTVRYAARSVCLGAKGSSSLSTAEAYLSVSGQDCAG